MTYQEIYDRSLASPDLFWQEEARKISWFKFPPTVKSTDEEGLNRWFSGGKLNTSYLALDYHVENGRGDQKALCYDSPVTQTKKSYTYQELLDEVKHFAGALKEKGVRKGDTVIIYMPMIPQAAIAMLACARLGAIHSVVFGGFAPHELAIRIDDARPKVLITASGGMEITRVIDYMKIVNQALSEATHQPDCTIVYQRSFIEAPLKSGRDFDWNEVMKEAIPSAPVPVDATDPLYILYTSGTTGTPKGVVRDNGGHAVAMKFSLDRVYGMKPGEVFWAASDVGWVVGHSYIVYAPLISGCTTILFEGKPIKTPDAGTFWRVIEEYKVKVLFTAPTAFRAIKKEDPNGQLKEKYDTSSLSHLFLAGERCDVNTLNWCENLLQVPVIDHWWQTESGWPMLSNMIGIEQLPVKPGSAGKPVCGYDIQIVDPDGQELPPEHEGAVVVKLPMAPGCLPTLWGNPVRFKKGYLEKFPGYYFTGDGGYKDQDGYVYITGRIDDIINVAGHRLSTAEMEEVLASHPAVAECAVVGIADELKGQVPLGFVVLKSGYEEMQRPVIEAALVQMVREQIGPVASFKQVLVSKRLPKTRSGKILRKIMRFIADGKAFKAPSTIEDITVLDEIEALLKTEHVGVKFK